MPKRIDLSTGANFNLIRVISGINYALNREKERGRGRGKEKREREREREREKNWEERETGKSEMVRFGR